MGKTSGDNLEFVINIIICFNLAIGKIKLEEVKKGFWFFMI